MAAWLYQFVGTVALWISPFNVNAAFALGVGSVAAMEGYAPALYLAQAPLLLLLVKRCVKRGSASD